MIKGIFDMNDWDYVELGETGKSDEPGQEDLPGLILDQDPHSPECEFCLCQPCITNDKFHQFWWYTEPEVPHSRNSWMRKQVYKKFWTMLFHRLVWQDPRYLARKEATLRQAGVPSQDIVWSGGRLHKRDIMPQCVVKLVRGWLPNPPNVDYMGHRWSK
jgi:hypothetical protein